MTKITSMRLISSGEYRSHAEMPLSFGWDVSAVNMR